MAAKLLPTSQVNPLHILSVRTHTFPHSSLLPHLLHARWPRGSGVRAPSGALVAAGRWKGVSWTHAYNNPARRACGFWLSAHRHDHRHPQDPHDGRVLPRQSGVQPAQGTLAARRQVWFLQLFDAFLRLWTKCSHVQEHEASSTVHMCSIMKAAAVIGADGAAGSPFAALSILRRREERWCFNGRNPP